MELVVNIYNLTWQDCRQQLKLDIFMFLFLCNIYKVLVLSYLSATSQYQKQDTGQVDL